MKKVLTVLLVIAVMFTFSFGSAFAGVGNYDDSLADAHFAKAMEAAEDADGITLGGYEVSYDVLVSYEADIKAAVRDYDKNGAATDYVNDVDGLVDAIEADSDDLDVTLVAAQFDADKADAVKILKGLSVADYSTAEIPDTICKDCKTYAEHVQGIIDDAVKAIEDAAKDLTSDSEIADYKDVKETKIDKYFHYYAGEAAEKAATKLVVEEGFETAGTNPYVGLEIYKLNKNYVDNGKKLDAYTTTYVEGEDAVTEANIASVKAAIASANADYLREDGANKTTAAAVKKMLDFLADEEVVKSTDVAALKWHFTHTSESVARVAMEQVAELEAAAEKLAAEKDSTGAYVRDAEDIADAVKAGTIQIYEKALNNNANLTAAELDALIAAIESVNLSLDDEKLAYMKKLRETFVTEFFDDNSDDYYPAELAKLKEKADAYLAKVNAATTLDKADDYDYDLDKDIAAVNDKKAVKTNAKNGIDKLTDIATKYADLLNGDIKKFDNKYYTDTLADKVCDLVGESGARTTKDINALSDQALELVKGLPTNADVEAAKDAADDAVKELPSVAKLADKATIDAAIAAVDAYEDLSGLDYFEQETDKIELAVTQYAYAYNYELSDKVDAVAKTDKAAVQALIDEIDAFLDAYEDYAENLDDVFAANKTKLEGYLDDIKATAASAVRKAISAIPAKANITEADIPTIEAARALYDAYVEEYTDYTDYDYNYKVKTTEDGFVADDFDYLALFNAETLVGLNATTDAEKVEALKITAKSTAKKGSITVKWTVKGEADIDGFQVWKSTKHSKGYKKAFTTTKQSYKNTKGLKAGTRYYYKVRAYKVVDGKNVYSDWSNKARRVAK